MQFNDTATRTGLIQECEFLTSIGKTQISGNTGNLQDFTRFINATYHEVVTMILDAQDEWDFDDKNHTDYPILTSSLVGSQQDYALPISMKILKLKRVEVSFDGSKWSKAEPLDINELGIATDTTTISGNFSVGAPRYDIQNNAIFLYPIPTGAVSGGLKIWISREIDEFTTADTTQEPGIDKPFHRMLAVGASLKYGSGKALGNYKALLDEYADYEKSLRRFYGNKQKDRDVTAMQAAFVDYK